MTWQKSLSTCCVVGPCPGPDPGEACWTLDRVGECPSFIVQKAEGALDKLAEGRPGVSSPRSNFYSSLVGLEELTLNGLFRFLLLCRPCQLNLLAQDP